MFVSCARRFAKHLEKRKGQTFFSMMAWGLIVGAVSALVSFSEPGYEKISGCNLWIVFSSWPLKNLIKQGVDFLCHSGVCRFISTTNSSIFEKNIELQLQSCSKLPGIATFPSGSSSHGCYRGTTLTLTGRTSAHFQPQAHCESPLWLCRND